MNNIYIILLLPIFLSCTDSDKGGKIEVVGYKSYSIDSLEYFKNIKNDSIKYDLMMASLDLNHSSCHDDSILIKHEIAIRLDQELRMSGKKDIMEMISADSVNQILIYSIIEHCEKRHYLPNSWIIIQHCPRECMSFYYSRLKRAKLLGKLKKSSFALTEDRLLMHNGFKQKYGTQIRGNQLYEIENPAILDSLRIENDLIPIEQYKAFMNIR